MKRLIFVLICFFLALRAGAQGEGTPVQSNRDHVSLAFGYGTQGITLFGDLRLKYLAVQNPANSGTLRFYMGLDIRPIIFKRSDLVYENISYPSDARLTAFSIGLGTEFRQKDWSLYPYFGLRYYYVRFTDPDLVEAIGADGVIRYWTDEFGNKSTVGPRVDNGYGNAISVDVGGMAGYRISKVVELDVLAGFSPVSFSTAKTLFGRYWGEAPYPNDYYVKVLPFRVEGRIRFHFK